MSVIRHVFGIGFRCNVPEFLKHYGMRNTASPFDWMLVDFDTAIKVIQSGFAWFLKDQVHMHHASGTLAVLRPDVPAFVPADKAYRVPFKFSELLKGPLRYFSQDYSDVKLLASIPYCYNEGAYGGRLRDNIYEWSHLCVFHGYHHDFSNPDTLTTLQRRVDRMKQVLKEHADNTLLFHITRIESRFSTLEEIVEHYTSQVSKDDSFRAYVAVIVCSDRVPDSYRMTDRVLVIVKHVPSYEEQLRMSSADNELRNCDYFKKEYDILCSHFSFALEKLQHDI